MEPLQDYCHNKAQQDDEMSPYQRFVYEKQMQDQISQYYLQQYAGLPMAYLTFSSIPNQIQAYLRIFKQKDIQNLSLDEMLKATLLNQYNEFNTKSNNHHSADQKLPADQKEWQMIHRPYFITKIIQIRLEKQTFQQEGSKMIRVTNFNLNYCQNIKQLLQIFTISPQQYTSLEFWSELTKEFVNLTNLHDSVLRELQKSFERLAEQNNLNFDCFRQYYQSWKKYKRVIACIIYDQTSENNHQSVLKDQNLSWQRIADIFLLINAYKQKIQTFISVDFYSQPEKVIGYVQNKGYAKTINVLTDEMAGFGQNNLAFTFQPFLTALSSYLNYLKLKLQFYQKIIEIDTLLGSHPTFSTQQVMSIVKKIQPCTQDIAFEQVIRFMGRGIRKKVYWLLSKHSCFFEYQKGQYFALASEAEIRTLSRFYQHSLCPR